jgi:hypothetical protein
LLHNDGPVSAPFPSARAAEMTDSLAENFKIRFNDSHCHTTNIRIFENLFSIKVSNAQEKLKLELTEMQYDLILCTIVVSTRKL